MINYCCADKNSPMHTRSFPKAVSSRFSPPTHTILPLVPCNIHGTVQREVRNSGGMDCDFLLTPIGCNSSVPWTFNTHHALKYWPTKVQWSANFYHNIFHSHFCFGSEYTKIFVYYILMVCAQFPFDEQPDFNRYYYVVYSTSNFLTNIFSLAV